MSKSISKAVRLLDSQVINGLFTDPSHRSSLQISSVFPILGKNLWEEQTTYLLCSTHILVKIVLKMFWSVELIQQLFLNFHSSKRKVYESWPTAT